MRVLQVEQSRPLHLPHLLVVPGMLLVVVGREEAGGQLRRQTPLKPHLPQEHVQREGSHHEARIKRESGSEGLHAAGPGLSPSQSVSTCQVLSERHKHGHKFHDAGPRSPAAVHFPSPRRVGEL